MSRPAPDAAARLVAWIGEHAARGRALEAEAARAAGATGPAASEAELDLLWSRVPQERAREAAALWAQVRFACEGLRATLVWAAWRW